MSAVIAAGGVALQRCDEFVGRTTNWLYDHLRYVPRYTPVVLCEALVNRDEFPVLKARRITTNSFTRRLWRRITGKNLYPTDLHWLRRLTPRVLHSHFGYVAAVDLPLRHLLDTPWIISFYGADVYQLSRQSRWLQAYDQIFNEAVRVLALGPAMAAHLQQLGCPPEKIMIHPLGVDVETLPCRWRERKPTEPLRILFAGTFREKKGIQ